MQLNEAFISGIAAMVLHELAHDSHPGTEGEDLSGWRKRRGAYIRREIGTAKQNLVITLSGPGINLVLAMLLHRISPNFALCNLVIGISNLLPIPASDGSRALHLLEELTRVHIAPINECPCQRP